MTFIQPYVFYGLPLVALPILIHLLNRLRYRSVKWAAVMFLVSATKSSIRSARLRHYIILAMRTLALLFLLLALSRPIAGGWLGAVAGGGADTVFMVLDRSASMEATGAGMKSLRQHALDLFMNGSEMVPGHVRFVLAETAGLTVQEIPAAGSLKDLTVCRATSSSADIPAMLQKVLEYAMDNNCGDMEVWIASDMQESNWRVSSPEWPGLRDRFGALPQRVRIRIIALAGSDTSNVMLSLNDARRVSRAGGRYVNLSVKLERSAESAPQTLPIGFSIGGVRQQEDAELASSAVWLMRNLALGDDQNSAGWGVVDIPVDGNTADNRCYFVYGGDVNYVSALVGSSKEAGRILGFAAAPDARRRMQSCRSIGISEVAGLEWSGLSMLIWQEGNAAEVEPAIEAFVRNGGSLVVFPRGNKGAGILGLEWGEEESVEEGAAGFSVISWESMEGPLARTGDGRDLPLSGLVVKRRQLAGFAQANGLSGMRVYASYRDGQPFLLGGRHGDGNVFICTTLPVKEWSDLDRGTVLVPMMQRILEYGGMRIGGARNSEVALTWRDRSSGWVSVDEEDKDPALDAGVYRMDGELVALNIPVAEFFGEAADEESVRQAMAGMDVKFVESEIGSGDGSSSSEIWPLLLLLAGLLLIGEAAMLSGDLLIKKEASGRKGESV